MKIGDLVVIRKGYGYNNGQDFVRANKDIPCKIRSKAGNRYGLECSAKGDISATDLALMSCSECMNYDAEMKCCSLAAFTDKKCEFKTWA